MFAGSARLASDLEGLDEIGARPIGVMDLVGVEEEEEGLGKPRELREALTHGGGQTLVVAVQIALEPLSEAIARGHLGTVRHRARVVAAAGQHLRQGDGLRGKTPSHGMGGLVLGGKEGREVGGVRRQRGAGVRRLLEEHRLAAEAVEVG